MNATAAATPYALIGGEPMVAAIVNRFYDLIETDPAYAKLRAIHAADLAPVRHGLTRFLSGWMGGPRDWFERGGCVMSLHRAFPIDRELADEWAGAMGRAITDQPGMEAHLAEKLREALTHMAKAMINLSIAD